MSELIKRKDAIKAIWGDDINPSEDGMVFEAQSHIDRDIRLISSTDRPQGEWLWSPRDTDGTVSGCCSNCSFSHLFVGGHTAQYNFCPNCGARMKGADDEID